MRIKRILSGLLAAGILCSLLVVLPAPAAAAGLTAFTDITDSATAEAAEILRVLGIVDGTGSGAFQPGRSLNRAEFCKMTVELMGNGGKVAGQMNRTVFKDVPSTHWARGYINVATTASAGSDGAVTPGIIRGDAYGNFNPDRNITFAEAVTILMRVLGYTDATVGTGGKWYSGYVSTAQAIGLTEGLSTAPEGSITRGQAAILFQNLLFTKLKDSNSIYLTRLGGSLKEDAIILSTDATAADGTTGSVQTNLDTYRTDRAGFPAELNGTRGKLALDKEGKLIAVLPRESDTYKRITLSSNNANYVTGADGTRIDVKPDTAVWKNGEQTTYDKVWATLKGGTSLTLCYNGAGRNDYIYIADSAAAGADASVLVLKSKPNGTSNPFSALGGGSAAMYKNGAAATLADLRQYDVGVYDRLSNTIQVSDRRLTGIYENAYPNTTAPSTIKVMGHDFPVMNSAIADLQSFKIGDRMTLLLTHDNRVAGAVTSTAASGTAVGVARVSAGNSEVTLVDGSLTLSGKNSLTEKAAAELDGKLVTVSSSKKGYLTLTKVSGSGATSALDLAAGTLGKHKLAPNVRFYDCVGGGAVIPVERESIALSKIPASKILFYDLDYAGRVSCVILNDVTGDCYQYGFLVYQSKEVPFTDLDGTQSSYTRNTVSVRQGGSDGKETVSTPVQTIASFRTGAAGGLAVVNGKLAGWVELTALKGIHRSAFDVDEMTLTTTDNIWPVSEKVECYNKTTGEWYAPGEEGLACAIAFSDALTVYYDKAPDQGGKIRLVVAE